MIYLTICLSIPIHQSWTYCSPSVRPSVHQSICPSVHLSISPYDRLSIRPSVCSCLSVHLSVPLSIHPSVRPSICPCVCLSIYLSLSVCPSVHSSPKGNIRLSQLACAKFPLVPGPLKSDANTITSGPFANSLDNTGVFKIGCLSD